MSRKYFEAIGRQAASLGRPYPYISLQCPEWASLAARDGWEHQRRRKRPVKPYSPPENIALLASPGLLESPNCRCVLIPVESPTPVPATVTLTLRGPVAAAIAAAGPVKIQGYDNTNMNRNDRA